VSRLFIEVTHEPDRIDGEVVLRDLEWVLLDTSGQLVSRGRGDGAALASLLGMAAAQDPNDVVVIVPAELCLWVQCTVPGRTTGQIRRALPFVVEEFLAGDVEGVHVAHGAIRRGAPVDCVVIDRNHVQGWLEGLKRLGLTPGHFVPAGALLPGSADRITVLFDGRAALLRTERQALAVDSDQVVYTLSTAVADGAPVAEESPAQERPALEIVTINGTIGDLDRNQIEQNAPREIRWTHEDTDLTQLQYLAQAWRSSRPELNLLQGTFAPPRQTSATWLRWRAVAALAGAWVLLAFVAETGKGLWAGHRADALREQTTALYREYFPNDQRVTNPGVQMRQRLGQAVGTGPGFLTLTGQFGKALATLQGAQLMSLGFSDGRDELTAEVTVAGFEALDALKTSLAEMRLATEITSAEQQEGGVRARLKVKVG
jgi:general secretion pathway protein L